MLKFQVFSAAGPVSKIFSSQQEAEIEANIATLCFGVELAVFPVCPCCGEIVKELKGNGFKVGAWACPNCGRAGC